MAVAWARPESGFTLPFEALLIEFATAMPVGLKMDFDSSPDRVDLAVSRRGFGVSAS